MIKVSMFKVTCEPAEDAYDRKKWKATRRWPYRMARYTLSAPYTHKNHYILGVHPCELFRRQSMKVLCSTLPSEHKSYDAAAAAEYCYCCCNGVTQWMRRSRLICTYACVWIGKAVWLVGWVPVHLPGEVV